MSHRWLLLQTLCRIAGQSCKALIIEFKMHRKNGFLSNSFNNKRILKKPLTSEKSGFKNKKMTLMECHHGNANTKRLLTLASEAPRVSQQNKLPMEQFNVVRAKRL